MPPIRFPLFDRHAQRRAGACGATCCLAKLLIRLGPLAPERRHDALRGHVDGDAGRDGLVRGCGLVRVRFQPSKSPLKQPQYALGDFAVGRLAARIVIRDDRSAEEPTHFVNSGAVARLLVEVGLDDGDLVLLGDDAQRGGDADGVHVAPGTPSAS